MSYKDYSVEAVKEIMNQVRDSQKTNQNSDTNQLSLVNSERFKEKSLSSKKPSIKSDYEYNRPTTAENNLINETHIFIEKWFESDLSQDLMWNEIQTKLDDTFADKDTSGKVVDEPSKKRWIYKNHSNFEMILSFTKSDRFVNLKVTERIGFWSAKIDGILHGSYTSLVLTGLLYTTYEPSISVCIGIFMALWVVNAFTIYKFSDSLRTKKHKRLSKFTDKLVESFTLRDEDHQLSNIGAESIRN